MIMDAMDDRMSALEAEMSAVKADIAVIKTAVAVIQKQLEGMSSTFATKADLLALQVTMMKWSIGCVFTLTGVIIGAVKFIH